MNMNTKSHSVADTTLFTSRRRFLGVVATAGVGAFTGLPQECKAFGVGEVITGAAVAIYLIGKFKAAVVEALGQAKKPGTLLADTWDAVSSGIYGSNYAEFLPKGDPF